MSFTDSNGVRWSVKEDGADDPRAHASVDGAPGTAWLRFESEYEVRRLWHYPDDWRGLNPLQLESLLDRASTVIARFRPVGHRSPTLGAGGQQSVPRPGDFGTPRAGGDGQPRNRTRADDPDGV